MVYHPRDDVRHGEHSEISSRVQGVDEAVSVRPRYLTFVIDQDVRRKPWGLKHFSDDLKDQTKLRFVKLRWFNQHFLIMKLL